MTARVWVAPIGTCATCGLSPCGCPPDDAPAPGEPAGEWTELGVVEEWTYEPLTAGDVCHAMGVDPGLLELWNGGSVAVTARLRPGALRNLLRVLGWRRGWGPPPLARGALPASTIARKRGGGRRG